MAHNQDAVVSRLGGMVDSALPDLLDRVENLPLGTLRPLLRFPGGKLLFVRWLVGNAARETRFFQSRPTLLFQLTDGRFDRPVRLNQGEVITPL